MNISACIITNNDRRVLTAIESVKNVCNEIIIVETSGRNDFQTELQKLNVKLYFKEWTDNFSEARNFAISKATGDWILIIDSDEIMRSEIKQLPDKYDMYFVNISINGSSSASGRIFKNNGLIKFENGVHETAEYTVSEDKKAFTNIIFEHTGYFEDEVAMSKKLIRNFKILLKDKSNRLRNYYLALTYYNFGKYAKAISTGNEALKDNIPEECKAKVSVMLFECFKALNEIKLYYLFKSLNYIPQQITARLMLYEIYENPQDKLKQLYEIINIVYSGRTGMQNDSRVTTEFLRQELKKLQTIKK